MVALLLEIWEYSEKPSLALLKVVGEPMADQERGRFESMTDRQIHRLSRMESSLMGSRVCQEKDHWNLALPLCF